MTQVIDLPCVTHCLQHLDHLGLSACRLNFLFCGFRKSGSLNSKFLAYLAIAEDLNAVAALGKHACVEKSLRVNNCAVLELFEIGNVDRLEGLCKDVVEASLRRARGIWPPSKPMRTPPPERAFWPLWPRPAVLPLPVAWPLPLRLSTWVEPATGESS